MAGFRSLRLLDRPDRRLLPAAVPVALLALAHSVPAGLVLPVIVAAADDQPGLVPNDLAANNEPGLLQPLCLLNAAQTAVPNVGDISGKVLPRLCPVGEVIV